jgi:hypothetical protein
MGFSERFPRWITAIIGLAQLLITAAIVGLEIGSAYIDLAHGTIWVGLWCGIIFIITFLMMLFISKYILISPMIFFYIFLFLKPVVAAVVVVPYMFLSSIVSENDIF